MSNNKSYNNWDKKREILRNNIEIMLNETKKFREKYDIAALFKEGIHEGLTFDLEGEIITKENFPENPIMVFSNKLKKLGINANDIFKYCDEIYGKDIFGKDIKKGRHTNNWRSMHA